MQKIDALDPSKVALREGPSPDFVVYRRPDRASSAGILRLLQQLIGDGWRVRGSAYSYLRLILHHVPRAGPGREGLKLRGDEERGNVGGGGGRTFRESIHILRQGQGLET